MILVKIHKDQHCVVAICDKDLVGKTITDGRMEIVVSKHFYDGEEKSYDEVGEIMRDYDNLNIFGEESVALALKLRIIEREHVLFIQGVPHAQTSY